MDSKADIAEVLRNLKDYGYKVKSFGDNRKGRRGNVGWVDTVIYNSDLFIAVEIKTKSTKDKFSKDQLETAAMLKSLMQKSQLFFYVVIRNVKQAAFIHDCILSGNLLPLRQHEDLLYDLNVDLTKFFGDGKKKMLILDENPPMRKMLGEKYE